MSDNYPSAVLQQSLDAAGSDHLLGDVEDGTRESQVCLRAYRQCLMQMLRAFHWDFARKEAPLTLLADASGNTPNVGTFVVGDQFNYEYSFPTDAVKVRYIPQHRWSNPGVPNNNILPPNPASPIMTGIGQPPYGPRRIQPARFLISNDANYPPPQGTQSWEVQGVSPQGRVVILTNVKDAKCVYTYLCLYPSVWDALFRAALVAFIASEIALPLAKDKKFGMEIRKEQIAIAKDKILQARAAAGNESGVNTSDLRTDWIDARRVGGAWGWPNGWDGGASGQLWGGYDDCCGAGVVGGAAF
jgi:hypothetical protein